MVGTVRWGAGELDVARGVRAGVDRMGARGVIFYVIMTHFSACVLRHNDVELYLVDATNIQTERTRR